MKNLIIQKDNRNNNLRILLNRKGDGVSFIEIDGYEQKGEKRYHQYMSMELTKEDIKKIKELLK